MELFSLNSWVQPERSARSKILATSEKKSVLPSNTLEKYPVYEEKYPIAIPGGGHISYDSINLYVVGAEVQVQYDRVEWEAHKLDSEFCIFHPDCHFELEIGGQIIDKTYLFSMDIMQMLFYGKKLTLLKKTDAHVIITLPMMFDHIHVGNVLPLVPYHQLKFGYYLYYNNVVPIAATAYIVLKILKCEDYGLLESYSNDENGGEKIIIQQQFTGVERSISTQHAKFCLAFNHLCHNLFIGFRKIGSSKFIQSPQFLKSILLQINGYNTILVDDPSKIYGTSPQFIKPKFLQNSLNPGTRLLFPIEVWATIYNFLSFANARSLSLTCKYLWNVSKKRIVWNSITKEYSNICPGWFCVPFFEEHIINYHEAARQSPDLSLIDNATLVLECSENIENIECYIFTTNFNVLFSRYGMMRLNSVTEY